MVNMKTRWLKIACSCALLWLAAVPRPLQGGGTVLQVYASFDDYSRGKLVNLSLTHDGHLILAPEVVRTLETGDQYIWCAAADSRGNLYLGTGNDGKVYRVNPQGDSTLFFDADEAQVFALAIDRQDRVYMATSPNGSIFQMEASGKSRIFTTTGQMYIWAMAFDAQGDLWVATGAKAQLVRIKPDGSTRIELSSEAEHIRSLLITPEAVYAGTSRPGLIYSLRKNVPPFVLVDAGAEEVHSLAKGPDGWLYAAALAAASPAGALMQILTAQQEGAAEIESLDGEESSEAPRGAMVSESVSTETSQSQLLRIDTDGYARNIWQAENGAVQTLFSDANGNLFAGSGDKGVLYQIGPAGELTLVLRMEASHISAIAATAAGQLAVATSNMGRCNLFGAAAKTGYYESEPLDAEALSTWGTLSYKGRGSVSFSTRSGNTQKPEATWSSWQPVTEQMGVGRIHSPAARFLQWRCELKAGNQPPEVREVSVSFIQKNRAPEILEMQILPQGIAFDVDEGSMTAASGITEAGSLPKPEKKLGFRSVSWDFVDANQDALWFSVYYRGEKQKHWRQLGKEIAQRVFSWDTSQMADGAYQLKIVASDSLLLPLGMGLSTEKLSSMFTIDNSGPDIKEVAIQRVESKGHLIFTICDALTPLQETWISINSGGWLPVYPVDGLADSPCEKFAIPLQAIAEEMDISIKTTDRNGNYSVHHSTEKGF